MGQLLYLTNTRLDICLAVQQLIEHVSNPMEHHYHAATHILKYLKSSLAKGVLHPSTSDLKLSAFADSDSASCAVVRKSITGFCVFGCPSLVSLLVHPYTVCFLPCVIQCLAYLLKELQVPLISLASVYCDSQFNQGFLPNLACVNMGDMED